jgi:hypothetical protein
MNRLGLTFQPQMSELLRRRMNQQNGTMGPMAQAALKILSMRLPDVLSGRPMAPVDLMRPRDGGAVPGYTGGRVESAPVSGGSPPPPMSGGPVAAAPGPGGLSRLVNRALAPSRPPSPVFTPGTPGTAPDVDRQAAAPSDRTRFIDRSKPVRRVPSSGPRYQTYDSGSGFNQSAGAYADSPVRHGL